MPLAPVSPLHGMVVAPHSPFGADGDLNLGIVERQVERFVAERVSAVFVCGSTGEFASLTVEERMALAARWIEVARCAALPVVVHVGANCLNDARHLAAHAEQKGAAAVAALCPSYFKPRSPELLVECAAEVAAAAPRTPFYYYHIPAVTGVEYSVVDFLDLAVARIPTLAGVKFSSSDLTTYQHCLRVQGGIWDLPWGVDQHLLAAICCGGKGAVGGSYNYSTPIFNRMLDALARGQLNEAREHQYSGTQLLTVIHRFGGLGAAKAVMRRLGVDVGRPRLPYATISSSQESLLLEALEPFGLLAGAAQDHLGSLHCTDRPGTEPNPDRGACPHTALSSAPDHLRHHFEQLVGPPIPQRPCAALSISPPS